MLIVFVITAIVMAATNPTKKSFLEYKYQEFIGEMWGEANESLMNIAFEGLDPRVEYESHILFSLAVFYTQDHSYTYFGVFRNWHLYEKKSTVEKERWNLKGRK